MTIRKLLYPSLFVALAPAPQPSLVDYQEPALVRPPRSVVTLLQFSTGAFPAAAAPAASVTIAASSADPIVVYSNTIITDPATPPQPPAAPAAPPPVFAQSPERASVGKGLPKALMQDGSDFVPFPPTAA